VYDGPDPDMDWYLGISSARRVTPRCPFASVERCPRYFQSIALLGYAGVSTKLPADEDERLQKYWEKLDLWPKTGKEKRQHLVMAHVLGDFRISVPK
jgi:hypothetical protein